MEIAVMIEGQDGLNWERWQRIVQTVEDSGYSGLFRSDHFTNANPPNKDSLELWASLTWLAGNTSRISFGPLVTPVSFRHPVMTARTALAVDDLSGGRLVLGVGAGWQVREHEIFGFDLLDEAERFKRFEEGLKVITCLMQSDHPVDFQGAYYRLKGAVILPRPKRNGGPPILVGGNGVKRTLPLAARYASEWNAVYLTPSEMESRNRKLDELLVEQGRQPSDLRRSVMIGVVYGRDRQEVEEKVRKRSNGRYSVDELRRRGALVGVGAEIAEQIHRLAEARVDRVMLQWLELDNIPGLELMAKDLLR